MRNVGSAYMKYVEMLTVRADRRRSLRTSDTGDVSTGLSGPCCSDSRDRQIGSGAALADMRLARPRHATLGNSEQSWARAGQICGPVLPFPTDAKLKFRRVCVHKATAGPDAVSMGPADADRSPAQPLRQTKSPVVVVVVGGGGGGPRPARGGPGPPQ